MKKTTLYNLIVAIAAVICLAFTFNYVVSFFQNRALNRTISEGLTKYKISNKDLVGKVKHIYTERRYWVPTSFPFNEFEGRLKKSLQKAGFGLSLSKTMKQNLVEGKKEWREEVTYLISKRRVGVPISRLTLIRRIPYPKAKVAAGLAKAKVAIVLDDWGYNVKNLADVLSIDAPLTLAILPNLRYSTTIAKKANENNFEVILHMPMEPKTNKIRLEKSTLYTTMNEDEIKAVLAKALKSVPYASGISNHEGSKATEDERTMRAVFGELKKQKLYFLDSLVTNESVCESLSRETGVKFTQRSIFLDNDDDPAYIKKQFEQLINVAVKTGDAIGVGHDKANTIAVLKEMLPKFEENSVQLVYVSGLAR